MYRLAAGASVPTPYNFPKGVLLMELVAGDDGSAAPRFNDQALTPKLSRDYLRFLINQVVRML